MAGSEFDHVAQRQKSADGVKLEAVLMDFQSSSPKQAEEAKKKVYSAPQVTDLGAIEQLSLGGSGPVMEGMQMTNRMKRP